MKIHYTTLSQKGQREQNEDSIYPTAVSNAAEEQNLFMVCDGVGGSAKGEIASVITCTTIAEYFKKHVQHQESGADEIEMAIQEAERCIDNYMISYPESQGLATTLALMHLHVNGITIAHVGDSRVYHIRNGNILFQTHDHSLVNEFITSGYITPQEAINHPKRNVITRAISGSSEHVQAEVNKINNIREGDYFLLCSDGILESINEDFIQDNFLMSDIISANNAIMIMEKINKACLKNSNDNYSAIIVQYVNA